MPAGKAAGSLDDQVGRIALLRELGAEALVLLELPMAALEHFARPMLTRKAAILPRLKEVRSTA